MAKIKTPLLSFRADGSLGKAITFARVKGGTIAKSIPSHPDARTLPQLYQRWRFLDAIYYWKWLPEANREAYKVAARPLNMTGWAYFLSQYLPDPPDQVLWLRLDRTSDAVARDYSGKANHGAILGAVSVPGVIDQALDYDGIDDVTKVPNAITLTLNHLTMMCFLQPGAPTNASPVVFGNETGGGAGYKLEMSRAFSTITAYIEIAGVEQASASIALIWGTLYHIAVTFDGLYIRIYLNGLLVGTTGPFPGNISPPIWDLWCGASHPDPARWFHGMQDDNRIYNRPLSPEHILEIATTQYWPISLI